MRNSNLLSVFAAIVDQSRKAEDTASGILTAIRRARAGTIEKFDAMVKDAYDRAGWNYKPGRPAADVEIVPVPEAVRTYVSEVRAAYREGLPVLKYKTMYELRKAVREARKPTDSGPRLFEQFETLKGVRVQNEAEFNGALFHDLIVTYEHADEDTREKIEAGARRLLGRHKVVAEQRLTA